MPINNFKKVLIHVYYTHLDSACQKKGSFVATSLSLVIVSVSVALNNRVCLFPGTASKRTSRSCSKLGSKSRSASSSTFFSSGREKRHGEKGGGGGGRRGREGGEGGKEEGGEGKEEGGEGREGKTGE